MSDRGTSNSPNTRNTERPASHPARLDQFADDMFEGSERAKEKLGVTSNKEKQIWLKKR